MHHSSQKLLRPRGAADIRLLFTVELLTSAAANFLQVGIFFYTTHRFQWSLRSNFLLAAVQGVTYVLGAMNANRLTRFWSRRDALTRIYFALCVVALLGAALPYSVALAILLPIYSGLAAMSWPMLEGLVSEGLESDALSRRIALYNVLWAAAGALVLAVNGTVIEHFGGGVFAFPAIFHGVAMTLMRISRAQQRRSPAHKGDRRTPRSRSACRAGTPATADNRLMAFARGPPRDLRADLQPHGVDAVAPRVSHARSRPPDADRQHLDGNAPPHLSRPGIYNLVARAPRILTVAAWLMLFAFLGTVVRPSDLLGHGTQSTDLLSMILCQAMLGVALGLIYAASLYFGMVLSDGSTEHGGYHEALIGLGSILGPGSGAIAQWFWPEDVRAGIIAVGSVITASVLAVSATALTIRLKARNSEAHST